MQRYDVLFQDAVVRLGECNPLTQVIATLPSDWGVWCSTPMAGQVVELQLQPTPSIGTLREDATQTTSAEVNVTGDQLVNEITYYSVEN